MVCQERSCPVKGAHDEVRGGSLTTQVPEVWGVLGLTLGALSLPSLGRIESTTDAGSEIGQELWLEAKSKKKKGKKASGKKKTTSEGSHTD
jgi:hypothetical protein